MESEPARDPIRVYLHAAAMGDFWREIIAELVGQIEGSGLYDAAESLTLVVTGGGSTRYLAGRALAKWRCEEIGQIHDYEYPTLRRLWQDAQADPRGHVIYLHTKGASSPPSSVPGAYEGRRYRSYWRQIMAHHLVTRWRTAIDHLEEYQADAAGCFLTREPWPHFAGNFWVARADYVTRLDEPAPKPGQHPRLWAEFWIGSGGGRLTELYRLPEDLELAFVNGVYRA